MTNDGPYLFIIDTVSKISHIAKRAVNWHHTPQPKKSKSIPYLFIHPILTFPIKSSAHSVMSNADPPSSLRSLLPQLLLGGTSVIPAIILTHPLDFIKLRQQLHGFKVASSSSSTSSSTRPVLDAVFRIARDEGPLRLFSGLSPAIVRAYTFSATRLGLYEPIRAQVSRIAGTGDEPTFGVKIVSALGSGMLGKFWNELNHAWGIDTHYINCTGVRCSSSFFF